ncbi:MAG: hypothetical protein LT070_02870 [Solirubrobacteraceae bacterium]|nr:hypothetical protein [Solirubrobacteraceae bacterium]
MSHGRQSERQVDAPLPILDELGDLLYEDHRRRESLRRRRWTAGAVCLALCATVAAALLALRAGPVAEPARVASSKPVQLVDGTSKVGPWRLIAVPSSTGPCMRLVVDSVIARAGNERCEQVPQSESALLVVEDVRSDGSLVGGAALRTDGGSDGRSSGRGVSFVYGSAPRGVTSVEITTSDGRTRMARTTPVVGRLGPVPSGLRYYVAVLDQRRARVVDVEATGSGDNPDLIIRVPGAR